MLLFPGMAAKNMLEKSKETLKEAVDFIPGSAVIAEGTRRLKQVADQSAQEAARKELLQALQNKESKDSVEKKLQQYKKTHNMKD